MSITTNPLSTTQGNPSPELIKAVPVRHPGRWVGAAVILVVASVGIHSLATNPNFHWDTFSLYVLDENVIRGVGWTLLLTVLSMTIAVTLAILLAFMRQSDNPPSSGGPAGSGSGSSEAPPRLHPVDLLGGIGSRPLPPKSPLVSPSARNCSV